jgi:hypothetical protein
MHINNSPQDTEGTQHASSFSQELSAQQYEKSSWGAVAGRWGRAIGAALPAFIITRLVFLLLTYLGGILFTVSNYAPDAMHWQEILYQWYRWDAIRFGEIATNGYATQDSAAFFPLYPVLEQIVSKILRLDVMVAGMLISNLALFGALVVLFRLVEMEFDSQTARRSVLYLSVFPGALFFFAAYNESLFLCFVLLSFYSLRRAHWWLAGVFGLLATLTRSAGLLLIVAFLCEFLRQQWPLLRRQQDRKQLAIGASGLLALLLIPLGFGIFAFALSRSFHDPLAMVHAQQQWRTGLTAPWTSLVESVRVLRSTSAFTFTAAHIWLDLGTFLFCLVLLLVGLVGPLRLNQDKWPFAIYGLLALWFAISFPLIAPAGGLPYDPLASMERFALEIFPVFIVLAWLGRRHGANLSYLLIALPLLAFLTLQFLTGHWTV